MRSSVRMQAWRRAALITALMLVSPVAGTDLGLGGTPPAQAADIIDTLHSGQARHMNDRLVSKNGSHVLMMQWDGNAVVYAPGGRAIWSTQTVGRPGSTLRMQPDGNLVVYDASNRPLWSTRTNGGGREGSVLRMQDDGNLVVYAKGNRPVWASRSQRWPTPPAGTYVESVTVHFTPQGTTYAVAPTPKGREHRGKGAKSIGWAEAVGRGVPPTRTLNDQYACHVDLATVIQKNKPTWNLDDWRPAGWANLNGCNR